MAQEIILAPSTNLTTNCADHFADANKMVDQAILAWLHAKRSKSDSARTQRAYSDCIENFRHHLHSVGLGLDGAPVLVALAAQVFAGGQEMSKASSYNQRLAILSSFYLFVRKTGLLPAVKENPLDRVERRKVEAYETSYALDPDDVKTRLAAIDLTSLVGQRDHCMLMIGLTTGRRVAELTGLRLKDLSRVGRGKLELHFRRCKGGKQMRDQLAEVVSTELLTYLKSLYPTGSTNPDDPIWTAVDSPNPRFRGSPLTARSLERICLKHLGTGHIHALRHTFAHSMEEAGAKVSDIQVRLGHSNLKTTGDYLRSLKKAENEHVDLLASLFL